MRVTEFIDYITRTDVKLGRNISEDEYTHIAITMKVKRARYLYQKKLRGEEPVK